MDLTPQTSTNDPLKDERATSGPRALADTMTWGERLLPLAYAAMQCCWMAALLIGSGRIHFFGQDGPFMPLWAPFLIVLVSAWCALALPDHTAGTQQKRSSFSLVKIRSSVTAVIIVQIVITLCVVWGTFYSNIALWNPIWLGTFFYDLLKINNTAFGSIFIILLSYGLSYQGIRIARYAMEPGTVTRGLIIGGIVFALVILLQAVSDLDQAYLLLLLLLFFSLALFTRALAHAIFVRQEHLIGLHGNKYTQERLIMSTVGLTCLLLAMIALIVSVIVNPALLMAIMNAMSPAGQLYDYLTHVIAIVLAFLLSFAPSIGKFQTLPTITPPQGPFSHIKQTPQQVPVVIQSFASGTLIIIIIAIVITIVMVTARIMRKRALIRHVQSDQHESLWSWTLFWSQFKRLLLALINRFKRHETAQLVEEHSREDEESTVVNRDVRAIYRAFLQWTASRGFTRSHNETPYELQQRLNQPFPPLEPEIQVVTEIYTTARYSQNQPTEAEIEHMQQNWNSLQKKSYGLQTES
jgi:hypothetical protein